jgi:hypothetical protein
MYRILCFLLFFASVSTIRPAEINEGAASVAPFPSGAPRELTKAWLRLHEEELCLGIDAVVVPVGSGYQVWSLVEDERHFKKLLKILQPLSESGRLEIFAAERVPEEKYKDGAPPSLWENDELRNFYRFPSRLLDTQITLDWTLGMISREDIFIQRLIIFSRQTLEKGENLRRYAKDLPALTHTVLNPALETDLRLLALKICRGHIKGIEEQSDDLKKNLEQALPKGKEMREVPLQDLSAAFEETSTRELAVRISEQAREISAQVHSFIYPESHTVEVKELRSPGILDSLRVLREMGEIYMRKMNRENVKF